MYRAAITRWGGGVALAAMGFFIIPPAAAEHGRVPAPILERSPTNHTASGFTLRWSTSVANYTSIVEIKVAKLPWSTNPATRVSDILPFGVRRTTSPFYDATTPAGGQQAEFVGLAANQNYELRARILHEGVLSAWSPTLPLVAGAPAATPILRALAVPAQYAANIIAPLAPSFNPFVTQYYLEVGASLEEISFAPVPDGAATVRLKPTAATRGEFARLAYGINRLQFVVTAAVGGAEKTYDLEITRHRFNNLDLATLYVSSSAGLVLPLQPNFNSQQHAYALDLPSGLGDVKIIAAQSALTTDPTQTTIGVTSNGAVTLVGSAFVLDVQRAVTEANFTVRSKANPGKHFRIYTVTLKRAAPRIPKPTFYELSAGNQTLQLKWLGPLSVIGSGQPFNLEGYRIRWSHDGNPATWENIGGAVGIWRKGTLPLTQVLENLPNGKEHRVQIAAYNANGIGAWSDVRTATPANDDRRLHQLVLSQGTLVPAFASARYHYNVAVGYNTEQLLLRPLAKDVHARVTVGGGHVRAGEGATQRLAAGATTRINIVVAAQNGTASRPYLVDVARDKGLPHGVRNLEAAVGAESLEVRWRAPADKNAPPVTTYKVRWKLASASAYGDAVTANETSYPLPALVAGETYDIAVAAVNKIGQSAWVATQGTPPHPPSDDASLRALGLSAGTLMPAFAPTTYNYTVALAHEVAAITIDPMATDEAAAKIFALRTTELAAGKTTELPIGVLAADGVASALYTLMVTRAGKMIDGGEDVLVPPAPLSLPPQETLEAPPSPPLFVPPPGVPPPGVPPHSDDPNANPDDPPVLTPAPPPARIAPSDDAHLLDLEIAEVAFAFVPATSSYNMAVSNEMTSLTLTPTPSHSGATITIGGAAVASGVPSASQSLAAGDTTTIIITVTAENGSTQKIYTLNATRALAAPQGLTITAGDGALSLTWAAPAGKVVSYRYRWSDDGDAATWESANAAAGVGIANSTSHTISGLANGTEYFLQVAAVANTTTGAWSARQSGTPRRPRNDAASLRALALTAAQQAHAQRSQAAEVVSRQSNAAHLSGALDVVTHHALAAGAPTDASIGFAAPPSAPALALMSRAPALISDAPRWRDSDWREVLGDSAFRLARQPVGAPSAWSLNVWGAGDVRGFDTNDVKGMGYAGYVGMDYGTLVWRGGVALGYNTTQSRAAGHDSESWFANVYPYLRLTPTKRLNLWMLLGAGGGALFLETARTDALHHFYAWGGELDLTNWGRAHFAAKTDASVAFFASRKTDALQALSLRHYRYRFALDTKFNFAALRPNLEIGMRLDADDDARTIGAEIAAGLQYRIGRVHAQARGRVLAYDTQRARLQEWGAGLTLRLLPNQNGLGVSASVAPSWGRTGARTDDIWTDDIGGDIGNANLALPTLALQTELAWTFRHKQARITPLAQYGIAHAKPTLGLGTRLALAPLALELLGEHITTQNEYRLSLTTRMRF